MSTVRVGAIIAVMVLLGSIANAQRPAALAQIYISNEWAESLQQLNFSTGKLTTLYNIGNKPDDITLSSTGELIYSVPSPGTVYMYNPTNGTNTVLASNIPTVHDLTLEPGGQTLLISKTNSPAELYRYSFATNTATVFFPKTKGITSLSGTAYDTYGNLYAVSNKNTIIQINPATAAIINTLTIESQSGTGADGMCYDSYTNSIWVTVSGKVLGYGLVQVPVKASGFVSTNPGFTFYSLPSSAPDGVKSDGKGNLYIGAIHTAMVYNIPTHAMTENVVTKGADGVALVPGTY